MPYAPCKLPEYPLERDMWDVLREEKRPVLVYGMGNGADKLFSRLEQYGVRVADVFASDGFVRGHFYKGIRVKSFSEIKELYSDFVILLSFASRREDVLSLICEIDGKYDMYIPDMPVAGAEEYFDREFYNKNYCEIVKAYEALADTASKNAFANIVSYKLSGKLCFLEAAWSDKRDKYTLFDTGNVKKALDLGAYNGDTAREFTEVFPALGEIVALEADIKNYKKLKKYAETICPVKIRTVNAAVWSSCGEAILASSGNRNSSVSSTASYQHKSGEVGLLSVDSMELSVDYIKYDVEGAEYEALLGTDKTVLRSRPVLSVSVYHRSRDIFSLVNYMAEKYPFYRLYIRRVRCVPAWEIDLICVPT